MNRLVSNAPQGSEQWLIDRIGYVTASKVADMMAAGAGITRRKYMVKMLCEMLTGRPVRGYRSKYMEDGNEREHTARLAYSMITNQTVTQSGFYMLPDEMLGASSDGEVDDTDGIIEIKNVIPTEQVDFITTGKIKGSYIKQMQTQMYVLDKQWCDFTSQCLGDEENGFLPDEYKIKIVRVYRDESMIREIRSANAKFRDELNQLRRALTKGKGGLVAVTRVGND